MTFLSFCSGKRSKYKHHNPEITQLVSLCYYVRIWLVCYLSCFNTSLTTLTLNWSIEFIIKEDCELFKNKQDTNKWRGVRAEGALRCLVPCWRAPRQCSPRVNYEKGHAQSTAELTWVTGFHLCFRLVGNPTHLSLVVALCFMTV